MHVDSWVIDELGTIGVPAMVVLGERDRAFAASAAVFEKYLDVRATVIVPGAGHNVHARQPEAVVEAMRGFLDALRSSGGGHRPSML
jgi:pimeloyl-ACP methyl ester carboxylesterase